MKLYTFSKNSWHVRFFQWLYGTNPTTTFKTMCPYFWTYVLTFIFIIPILLVRSCGKWGKRTISWAENYKRNKIAVQKQKFLDACTKDLTDEEAYKIRNTKCWSNFYWYLDSHLYIDIKKQAREHEHVLRTAKYEKEKKAREISAKRVEKYKEVKESKVFTYIAYIVTFALLGLVLFTLGWTISLIPFSSIPYKEIGIILGIIIIAVGFGFGVVVLGSKLLPPLITKIQCITVPECGICKRMRKFFGRFAVIGRIFGPVGVGIGNGFKKAIVGTIHFFGVILDMLHSTYKKKCPIITWTDE